MLQASGVSVAPNSANVRQRHLDQKDKTVSDKKMEAMLNEPVPGHKPLYAPVVDLAWRVWTLLSGVLGMSVQEPVEVFIMRM